MAFRVPQFVEVRNPRLVFLYYFLVLLVVIFLAWNFVRTRQIFVERFLEHGVEFEEHVTGWHNSTALKALGEKHVTSAFCKRPEEFDYWADAEGWYNYEFQNCSSVCSQAGATPDCIHPVELVKQEGHGEFFMPTFKRSTLFHGSTSQQNVPHTVGQVLPFIEALTLNFNYYYKPPSSDFSAVSAALLKYMYNENFHDTEHSSARDITTVWLDSNSEAWRITPPGEPLSVTVPELLAAAGQSDFLDTIQQGAGPNYKANAEHPQGVLGRVAGLELRFELDCFAKAKEDVDGRVDGRVCYVHVVHIPKRFVGNSRNDIYDASGNMRFVQYNGIRVKFVTKCSYTGIELTGLMVIVSSWMIYLSLPRKMVQLLMVWTLGHLSAIYRNVIYRKFSIPEQVAGASVRLIGNSVIYNQLQDQKMDGGGISREKVGHRMRDFLRHRGTTLNKYELDALVTFVFARVGENEGNTYRASGQVNDIIMAGNALQRKLHYFTKKLAAARTSEGTPPSKDHTISIDEFSGACANNEDIDFEAVIKLFDNDRKWSFFESFFLPPGLKTTLRQAKVLEEARQEKLQQAAVGGIRCSTGLAAMESYNSLAQTGASHVREARILEHEGRTDLVEKEVEELRGKLANIEPRLGGHDERFDQFSSLTNQIQSRVDSMDMGKIEKLLETMLERRLGALQAALSSRDSSNKSAWTRQNDTGSGQGAPSRETLQPGPCFTLLPCTNLSAHR